MAVAKSSARFNELTKSGIRIGIIAFICSKRFPSPKSTPRARCAFIIFCASSIKVGTKRSAIDSINATSCTGNFTIERGFITASMASVNCNGAVVSVKSVEKEIINTKRKKMNTALIIPSEVTWRNPHLK